MEQLRAKYDAAKQALKTLEHVIKDYEKAYVS